VLRGEPARARKHLEQAVLQVRPLLQADSRHSGHRESLCRYTGSLAETLLKIGDHQEAATMAEEAARLGQEDWKLILPAVRILAGCMPLAEKDNRLPEAERRSVAEAYGGRAVRLLQQAVEKGYQDAAALQKATDFGPLRQRADFQKLVRTLAEKFK
jgi:hypothetical protein